MIVTFLFPDTESARTEGKRVTSPVGAKACHSHRGVCVRARLCLWEPLSLRVTSWERIEQEAGVRAGNKHLPHLYKEAFLSPESKKQGCVCVSLTLPEFILQGADVGSEFM